MTTISVVVAAAASVIVIRPFWYFVTVALLSSLFSAAPRFDPRLGDADYTHRRNQDKYFPRTCRVLSP